MAALNDVLSSARAAGFTHCQRVDGLELLPLDRLDEDVLALVLAGRIAEALVDMPFWHLLHATAENPSAFVMFSIPRKNPAFLWAVKRVDVDVRDPTEGGAMERGHHPNLATTESECGATALPPRPVGSPPWREP